MIGPKITSSREKLVIPFTPLARKIHVGAKVEVGGVQGVIKGAAVEGFQAVMKPHDPHEKLVRIRPGTLVTLLE